MASTRLCIQMAGKDPEWGQYDSATKSALAILKDCGDRRLS